MSKDNANTNANCLQSKDNDNNIRNAVRAQDTP